MVRTTVVYESMFGATREIAEAIARGLTEAGGHNDVTLRRTSEVTPEEVTASDLLVVGGPTHVHSLSRPETRKEAEKWSRDRRRS
jgi:flavorubredoxin